MSAGVSGDFPQSCLRGIRHRKWIVASRPNENVLSGEAYVFELAPRLGLPCQGWHEVSVNWEDDADAVAFTRGQRSDAGHPLNPHGVGRLSVDGIELCKKLLSNAEGLLYERREEPTNRYHGNLLVEPALPPQFQRLLGGALGLATRVVT